MFKNSQENLDIIMEHVEKRLDIHFIYFLFIFNLFYADNKIEYNLVYLCNNS